MSTPETELDEKASPDTETIPEKPDGGTDFVEFQDEKTEKRFKKLYWNMKQYELTVDQLAGQNAKLVEKLESMEKEQAEKESKGQIQNLSDAEKEAMENGDFSRASDIRDQITDLKVAAAKQPEPAKEEPQGLTATQERIIQTWAEETDSDGEYLRPWAADEAHEDFDLAKNLAVEYIKRNPEADLNEVLGAVDKRMNKVAPKPRPKQAAVLGGEGGVRPKTQKKTNLSENEKLIARRMFPKEKDPLARYAKAKEQHL